MPEIYLTNQFKFDLDKLENDAKKSVTQTIEQIEIDPRYPGLNSKKALHVPNRNIWRSRVTRDYRLLWEWHEGAIRLWRVGKHTTIDAVDFVRAVPRGESLYIRNPDTNAAQLVSGVEADPYQPQPFQHVPLNILRLYGVPDAALETVRSLRDEEAIWDLPIPENVQWTLYSILSNPNWTLEDLLDSNQLLYRTTVDQLEGYCEGKIKKLLLNLNEEQQSYVTINATGPVLIKGVAGSGKTTIGLYRANYLAQQIEERRRLFDEETSILLMTYSLTLTSALEQLYEEKYGELPQSITVAAYKEWMRELLSSRGFALRAASERQRRDFIEAAQVEVARESPKNRAICNFSVKYLLDEIDSVIRARALSTVDAYTAVSRRGRGTRLDRERHRPLVWKVYKRYQAELDRQNLFDWTDLSRLVLEHCQPLPQFDVLIIDEAQDMAPCDLQLMTKLIPDYRELRSLTLLADPAQSIYYRGIPWKEGGIEIRGGRTQILAKNYRNTREILEAARGLAEQSKTLTDENEYIPPTSTHRRGPKPQLVQYEDIDDCEAFVVGEIVKLCQTGNYRPGDVAIAATRQNLLGRYKKGLSKAAISCVYFRDENFHILENEVKLITMPSTKGLEFPVMFLVGLSESALPWIKSPETQEEDEESGRKLLYVGMTRASDRLYLLHSKYNRSPFLRELSPNTTRKRKL